MIHIIYNNLSCIICASKLVLKCYVDHITKNFKNKTLGIPVSKIYFIGTNINLGVQIFLII